MSSSWYRASNPRIEGTFAVVFGLLFWLAQGWMDL